MNKHDDVVNAAKRAKPLPEFNIGDNVDVQVLIREGDKERIQIFNGTVIARRGKVGPSATFTVRRIVQGEGVERIFPINSPKIVGLAVKTRASVRRAKLYYLRGLTGKAAKLKEIIG